MNIFVARDLDFLIPVYGLRVTERRTHGHCDRTIPRAVSPPPVTRTTAQLAPMTQPTIPGSHEAAVIRRLIVPLARFFDDRSLFEIIVNRPGEVFIEGAGGLDAARDPRGDLRSLDEFRQGGGDLFGPEDRRHQPVLSATLPGNERIQIVIPPAVPAGTVSVTVRKPSQVTMTLADLGAGGLFDAVIAEGMIFPPMSMS